MMNSLDSSLSPLPSAGNVSSTPVKKPVKTTDTTQKTIKELEKSLGLRGYVGLDVMTKLEKVVKNVGSVSIKKDYDQELEKAVELAKDILHIQGIKQSDDKIKSFTEVLNKHWMENAAHFQIEKVLPQLKLTSVETTKLDKILANHGKFIQKAEPDNVLKVLMAVGEKPYLKNFLGQIVKAIDPQNQKLSTDDLAVLERELQKIDKALIAKYHSEILTQDQQ